MLNENWFCKDHPNAKGYLEVCKQAVSDENSFNTFKNNPIYREILEHTSYDQALTYLGQIELIEAKNTEAFLQLCKSNDLYGGANLDVLTQAGYISPATLRYSLFASRLKHYVKKYNLTSKKYLEIGGGYGGMALVAHSTLDVSDIYMNDLDLPLELQRQYLNKHNILCTTEAQIENLYNTKFDICVSTFAFSELIKNHRDKIVQNIFPNCKLILLVCNFINNEIFQDSELEKTIDKSLACEIIKETHEGHLCSTFIIVNH